MKLVVALFSCTLMGFISFAQQASPDQVGTKRGKLKIQPILHGTVVLTWDNKTIYVDPYGGVDAFKGIAAPDLILITDIHGDHLDLKTLDAIDTQKATIIAPKAVGEKLPGNLKSNLVVLSNGQTTTQFDIKIHAIPMYNLPESPDSRHTKGRGNGYILTIGGKRVYLSGDTSDIPEMRKLKRIDVAFVCMNEPYTMDINQAASAVLDFKPKVVYPYHYRGPDGLSDVEAFKKLVAEGNNAIDVRLRNWYP